MGTLSDSGYSADEIQGLTTQVTAFSQALRDYHYATDFLVRPTVVQIDQYLHEAEKIRTIYATLVSTIDQHGVSVSTVADAAQIHHDINDPVYASYQTRGRYNEDASLMQSLFGRLDLVEHQIAALEQRADELKDLRQSGLGANDLSHANGAGQLGVGHESLSLDESGLVSHRLDLLPHQMAALADAYHDVSVPPFPFKLDVEQFNSAHSELGTQNLNVTPLGVGDNAAGYAAPIEHNQSLVSRDAAHVLMTDYSHLDKFGSLAQMTHNDALNVVRGIQTEQDKSLLTHGTTAQAMVGSDTTFDLSRYADSAATHIIHLPPDGADLSAQFSQDISSAHHYNDSSVDPTTLSHDISQVDLPHSLNTPVGMGDSGDYMSATPELHDPGLSLNGNFSDVLNQAYTDPNPLEASTDSYHHLVTGADVTMVEPSGLEHLANQVNADEARDVGTDAGSGHQAATGFPGLT
ncbi:MAG: hypothetical protein V4490_08305 [Pseudomonadota bacterium]